MWSIDAGRFVVVASSRQVAEFAENSVRRTLPSYKPDAQVLKLRFRPGFALKGRNIVYGPGYVVRALKGRNQSSTGRRLRPFRASDPRALPWTEL